MTPQWRALIIAEKIKVLGECIKENEERTSDIDCCPDLVLINQKYCTKCGDGVCKSPEDRESCSLDCTKINEVMRVDIFVDSESFDLTNKTFEGKTETEGKVVKILVTDTTKFYRTAAPTWGKEYFAFSEFHSLCKEIGGRWPFVIKGILEKEGIIKASEVFIIEQ